MEDFYVNTDRRFFKKSVINKMIFSGLLDYLGVKLVKPEEIESITAIRNALLAELNRLDQIPKPRKRKEVPPPERLTIEQYWEQEKEVLGLCLSKRALLHAYAKECEKQGWSTIEQADYKGDCYIFGRIDRIEACKSKAGKSMRKVTISDDINEIMFFVFEGAINQFHNRVKKTGTIVAIPTRRFDDSKQRFFFDRKDVIVLDLPTMKKLGIPII